MLISILFLLYFGLYFLYIFFPEIFSVVSLFFYFFGIVAWWLSFIWIFLIFFFCTVCFFLWPITEEYNFVLCLQKFYFHFIVFSFFFLLVVSIIAIYCTIYVPYVCPFSDSEPVITEFATFKGIVSAYYANLAPTFKALDPIFKIVVRIFLIFKTFFIFYKCFWCCFFIYLFYGFYVFRAFLRLHRQSPVSIFWFILLALIFAALFYFSMLTCMNLIDYETLRFTFCATALIGLHYLLHWILIIWGV